MFRKIVLPLAVATLMAGCATTAPYGYRGGAQGDYYYGSPSTEYRYHGVYPGYGYPYYGPYRPGFYGSFRYGYPHGYYGRPYYGNPYYGHPYYGYPYQRPIYRPRPTRPDTRPDGGGWRNFDELRRRGDAVTTPGNGPSPTPSIVTPSVPREPRMRGGDGGGSRMGEMIRRAREGTRPSSAQDE